MRPPTTSFPNSIKEILPVNSHKMERKFNFILIRFSAVHVLQKAEVRECVSLPAHWWASGRGVRGAGAGGPLWSLSYCVLVKMEAKGYVPD